MEKDVTGTGTGQAGQKSVQHVLQLASENATKPNRTKTQTPSTFSARCVKTS